MLKQVYSIDYTTITPVATVATASITSGVPFVLTITFPISVTGFTIADMSIMNGVFSNFSGSGDTYTVTITPPLTGSGSITVVIAANSVNEGNAAITRNITFTYDPNTPVIGDIFGVAKADNGAVNLPIDVESEVYIEINNIRDNNSDRVVVKGLQEGFSYDMRYNVNRIYITGTPDSLKLDALWSVEAERDATIVNKDFFI